MFLGPVENDHRRGDFGQAAHLSFLSWLLLFQNETGLRINNHDRARGVQVTRGQRAEDERKKDEEKPARSSHGKVHRCTVIVAICLATVCRAFL